MHEHVQVKKQNIEQSSHVQESGHVLTEHKTVRNNMLMLDSSVSLSYLY